MMSYVYRGPGENKLVRTNDYIKIFTWPHHLAPKNLAQNNISVSSWGKPSVHIKRAHCDINRAFQEQKILFTLPVCGNPPGTKQFWTELDGGSGVTCDKVTKEPTCESFVAKNPKAFENFYFQIKDLRWYEVRSPKVPTIPAPTNGSAPVNTLPRVPRAPLHIR